MLNDVGHYALVAALLLSLGSACASLLGARIGDPGLVTTGRRALGAVFALVLLAAVCLVRAFVASDFRVEFVASHSSTTLPLRYRMTALWAGQAGSILFWTLLLSLFSSIAVWTNRRRSEAILPYTAALLALVQSFFLIVLNFSESPFRLLASPPLEGRGMNPQLQNYWHIIHPPTLYIGFTSVTIPFAFAVGALWSGSLGRGWLQLTRRWTLFSWFALTLGILFGSYWAYVELGWGGYWAWDPVENASFLPWLTMTAFLHSVMIQEKKGMLKVWNLALAIASFGLTILGTFLTRSGVIDSVHAFALSNIGSFFTVFLGIVLAGAYGLLVWRLPRLRSDARLESAFSRESSFLFNNLLLLAVCFAVLLGTTFPILSEWVRGTKVHVGPPFFNAVVPPIAMLLLVLAGVCPLIAWRRASLRGTARALVPPAIAAAAAAAVLALAGIRRPWAFVAFGCAAFVLATVAQEYGRGMRVWMGRSGRGALAALGALVSRNQRRYGGYVVHAGVALAICGMAAVGLWKQEVSRVLRPGESLEIGGFTLTYRDFWVETDEHRRAEGVRIDVRDSKGRARRQLLPERSFFATFPDQPVSEIALLSFPRGDLYAVSEEVLPDGSARIHVFWNPLMSLLWIGGLVMAIGTLIAVLPSRLPSSAFVLERPAVADAVPG